MGASGEHEVKPGDIVFGKYKGAMRQFCMEEVYDSEAKVRPLYPELKPKENIIINLDDLVILNIDARSVDLKKLETIDNPIRLMGLIQEYRSKKS